LSVADILSRR